MYWALDHHKGSLIISAVTSFINVASDEVSSLKIEQGQDSTTLTIIHFLPDFKNDWINYSERQKLI